MVSILANELARRGHSVSLVLASDGSESCYEIDPNVQMLALSTRKRSKNKFSAVLNNCAYLYRLRRAIISLQTDVVISFLTETNIRVLLALMGTKQAVIVSERNDPALDPRSPIWRIARRVLYRFATCVVAQSRYAQQYLHSESGADSEVIANPVRAVSPIQRTASMARKLLAIGRLESQKGFDVLLQSFAMVAAKVEDARLTIVGKGSKLAELQSLARTLGIEERVTFAGATKNVDSYLSNAGIFVSSSRYEGFPNALCEAMAMGLAVVTTDCPGAVVDIVVDSVNGFLTPVDDPQALADRISQLLLEPELQTKLGANAAGVSQTYSVESVVTRWEGLCRNVRQRHSDTVVG